MTYARGFVDGPSIDVFGWAGAGDGCYSRSLRWARFSYGVSIVA